MKLSWISLYRSFPNLRMMHMNDNLSWNIKDIRLRKDSPNRNEIDKVWATLQLANVYCQNTILLDRYK